MDQIFQSLLRLRGNPDFEVVMSHIEALELEAMRKCAAAPKKDVCVMQGHVRAYGKLLKLREDAQDALERTKT